jgi:hypothetical protein
MVYSNEALNQGQEGNGGADSAPAERTGAVDLKASTKEQLLAFAEKIGVKAKPAMSKDEIVKAIEDFQAAREADGKLSAEGQEGNGGGSNSAKNGEDDEKPLEKTTKAIPHTGDPIGAIKTINGVEYVNVGTAWIPTIRNNAASNKPVVVVSKKRAGRTIYAKTGKAITFDENGRATVSAEDAQYLTGIIINEVPEYTAEENE